MAVVDEKNNVVIGGASTPASDAKPDENTDEDGDGEENAEKQKAAVLKLIK